MALNFNTDNPQKLLAEFKKAIDEGRVSTWSYDKDNDFTHTPDQWKNRAWLRPKIETNKLTFYIIRPEKISISSEVYAIYHGRFIESMLHHCDTLFSEGSATALSTVGDDVAQAAQS